MIESLTLSSKAMHELKELYTRLDLGVKKLEATWDPIDMAIFEEVNIEERSSDSGMSTEATAEGHEGTQSKKWNTIDEWVVQVRDATIIES